jgi:hypothetical protein
MRDTDPRECPVCHASFVPRRKDQEVCRSTCRQRKRRGTYMVTEEDRAAIRRVLERDGCGHPRTEQLTPDEVREHVLRTAERT